MKYAIKTKDGYLCVQGETHWTQPQPIGWAVISDNKDYLEYANTRYLEGVGEIVEVGDYYIVRDQGETLDYVYHVHRRTGKQAGKHIFTFRYAEFQTDEQLDYILRVETLKL